MLGRLTRKGFREATRMGIVSGGPHHGKTVVRVHHAKHGWMYEKIDELDEAASDAAVDSWVAKANDDATQ